jgi:16S rRNA (uracil1498-N3)-methyltransferase
MKRIFLPSSFSGEETVVLSGPDFHHLIRVARYRAGDRLKALDAHGNSYDAEICRVSESEAVIRIEKENCKPAYGPCICLVQSLPKGKKMDLIVRQAAETGVSRIQPVLTRHSVVRLESENDVLRKRERWTKIAREAMAQSGSRIVPEIGIPAPIENITFEEDVLSLLFHQELSSSIPLHTSLLNDYKMIYILIGPEGGFAADEVQLLTDLGAVPVYLGENILRVETAALYAIAAVRTILSEKETWRRA